MWKYMFLFAICVFCFLYFNENSCLTIALFENIDIHNIAKSNKFIAVESDEIIDGDDFHYIFLYDTVNDVSFRVYSNTNEKINSSMYFPSISEDGKYLTFTSRADNITGDEINKCLDISDNIYKNCSNIYLYDIEKKQSLLIKYNGDSFNGDNYVSKISGDGKSVVFESISTNLLNNDYYDCSAVNGVKNCINIYKYNVNEDFISLVSTGNRDYGGDANSVNPSISEDGRFITFQSSASNLISSVEIPKYCNNYISNELELCSNVFFVDTNKNKIKILSYYNDKIFNDNSGNAMLNSNGDFVVFESYASNISKEKIRHLYLYSIKNNECKIISKKDGIMNNRDSFVDDISKDGKYILYRTDASNLDNTIGIDLYVYNVSSEKISLLSNDNISYSFFYDDKVYYYNNKQFFINKIDDISPVLYSNKIIYIIKDNVSSIKDKIEVFDNLSMKENLFIQLENIEMLENAGEYLIKVNVVDEFNNACVGYVKIVVLNSDEESPIFSDINEIRVVKGTKTLNLSNFIEARDMVDGITRIFIVDDGGLNLDVSGKYKIKLMSKDDSNNIVYKEIYIVVYENYSFNYFYEIIIILGLIVVVIFSIIKVK